jgi:hypothetical protein
MKTLGLLVAAMFVCGTTLLAQNAPANAHPAAADPHPAVADTHPAKAEAHPAKSDEKHPANPGHSSETDNAPAQGAILATAPDTNSLNATTPTPIQTFSVPTFVPTPPLATGISTPATTNTSTSSTNQSTISTSAAPDDSTPATEQ